MAPSLLKSQYDAQGYVIVPGLITPDERTVLEDACKVVISKTRSGEWTHRRTVGKQFPPFGEEDPDSWGVQHVMHPELRQPTFAKWYTSDPLIDVAKQLLDCQEEDLQMGDSYSVTYIDVDSADARGAFIYCRAFQSSDQSTLSRFCPGKSRGNGTTGATLTRVLALAPR